MLAFFEFVWSCSSKDQYFKYILKERQQTKEGSFNIWFIVQCNSGFTYRKLAQYVIVLVSLGSVLGKCYATCP